MTAPTTPTLSGPEDALVAAQVTPPAPEPRFFTVEAWAAANSLGINAVYEYLRRRDPLPHIRQGRRYLIDDELAVAWMRRNFGAKGGVT